MTTFLTLSAYRPVQLILAGLAVLVLAVITGQVVTLARHNRGRKPHRPVPEVERDR